MMPTSHFYLGTAPSAHHSSAAQRPQSMSQVSLQQRAAAQGTSSPTNRMSMPPPRRPAANDNAAAESDPDTSTFVNQSPAQSPTKNVPGPRSSDRGVEPVPIEVPEENEDEVQEVAARKSPTNSRRQRNGTMDRNFRFPSPAPQPAPPVPPLPSSNGTEEANENPLSPTSIPVEVPPPDPVEKERERQDSIDAEDDIGATEEISLN